MLIELCEDLKFNIPEEDYWPKRIKLGKYIPKYWRIVYHDGKGDAITAGYYAQGLNNNDYPVGYEYGPFDTAKLAKDHVIDMFK